MTDFVERVMVCWEMAEEKRKDTEQGDYDDELGIDRDSEDGYVEDCDAWDQPAPSHDNDDEDEGYNTHVDVD